MRIVFTAPKARVTLLPEQRRVGERWLGLGGEQLLRVRVELGGGEQLRAATLKILNECDELRNETRDSCRERERSYRRQARGVEQRPQRRCRHEPVN